MPRNCAKRSTRRPLSGKRRRLHGRSGRESLAREPVRSVCVFDFVGVLGDVASGRMPLKLRSLLVPVDRWRVAP